MPEGETYVSNACPLQYVVWGLVFACWIAEFWVFALLIRGKLYVAEARLMKGGKEPEKVAKRTKKEKKEVAVEEPVKEEAPQEEPAPEEPAPAPIEEAPAAESTPAAEPEAKAEPENNEKKD